MKIKAEAAKTVAPSGRAISVVQKSYENRAYRGCLEVRHNGTGEQRREGDSVEGRRAYTTAPICEPVT